MTLRERHNPGSGKILVTGATGNVASLLIPALREAGEQVRALIRNESQAKQLRELAVEVVIGDMERPETLERAVTGVDKIYLITSNAQTGAQQGRNVIKAAKRAGRPHIVRQTAYGTSKSRIIQQTEEVERELEQSGLPYTLVKPTFFMQNIMMAAQTVASSGVVYMPFKDGRLGMIDVRDVAEVALKVLTSEGHEGKTYVLTGPASISFHDVAAGLSKATGKEVKYVDVPLEAGRDAMIGMGMPEWTADGFVELMEGFSEGYADKTTPYVEQLAGHPARSFETFARDFAQVFGGAVP